MTHAAQPESIPDFIPPWVDEEPPAVVSPGQEGEGIEAGPASPATAPAAFEPPSVEALNASIADYQLKVRFFADRTGALYRAYQPHLDRDVAIKVLPPVPAENSAAHVEAFEHEARTMARLNHPNIVKVYDFGQTADGLPYFVMEYVEGAILEGMIRSGQITLDHVFGWIPQVCEALQYAHEQYISHCDVNPANILLTMDGTVKVANFGLSQLEGQGAGLFKSSASDPRTTGMAYTAPEVQGGVSVPDYRRDIYSLGVILYEMLTGTIPIGTGQPPSEVAGLDPRFDEIVFYALQENPADRWQSALDISNRILTIEENPPMPPRRRLKFG